MTAIGAERKLLRAANCFRFCPSAGHAGASEQRLNRGGQGSFAKWLADPQRRAPPITDVRNSAGEGRREAACAERSYWGHTRLLGVYELAFPGSVLIAVISLPLGETNISKVGRPIPGGCSV